MNEIEDAVTTRIHPRNKVGPRYRTLWWNAGCELPKISLSLEFCEVGHLAFAHKAVQELRIHAVDPENDQALIAVRFCSGGAAGRQHRHCDQKQGSAQYPGYFLQRLNPQRVVVPIVTRFRKVVRLLSMLRHLGSWFFLGILTLFVFPIDSLAEGKTTATKPNIVLITLDSTRADRMGFLGARSGLTPSLDGIARQGMVFAQAYAQAPFTVVSTATILTGTYPQSHRASDFSVPLATTLPYLPDLLHSGGYRTAAFVGSILLDPRNGPFQGYDRGFDVYDAGFHQGQRGENRFQSVERHGDQVVARATTWVASNKQRPFFLWVKSRPGH